VISVPANPSHLHPFPTRRSSDLTTSSADLRGADSMTDRHFANFIAGIRKGEKLNAPISVGNVAVTMLQLSNIAKCLSVMESAPRSEEHTSELQSHLKLVCRLLLE